MTSLNENGDFQRRPHPAPMYQVVSSNGDPSTSQFPTAQAAADWAKRIWPDQQQDPDRTGAGWDVEAVR